jgi:hypothetical protein
MNKPPTSRTVLSGGNRRSRMMPDASIPDWAAHKRHSKTPRQRERKAIAVGEARRNAVVALVRSTVAPVRKRGGAKYGPAPRQQPHERMQAPKPMDPVRRVDLYTSRLQRLPTDRQERRLCRLADLQARAEGLNVPGPKGRSTPKRGAR